ncbi:hypothetical protein HQN89_34795 [Paenibacillus frigoriresistens]|uniref:hypothetical protein n=1 Tax=Paenibacillus alginolyticus TaxID=59839 RepID=UPI0015673315|nr:hypothetical protein [Paenibacillus frigoriresistens]NRF95976.1 hypothetical protein [Paenibacillus frigoriresistens]
MNIEGLRLEIKEAEESQLDFLVTQFSPDNPKFQYNRFAIQKRGEGLYLIAWHNNAPVGHFLLRWSGPNVNFVTKLVDIKLTIDEYRRKGIVLRHGHEVAICRVTRTYKLKSRVVAAFFILTIYVLVKSQ